MKKLSIVFLAVPVILFCMAMQNDLKLLDLGAFKITVPANWKYIKQQGEDSFVGQIKGPGVSLTFDFSNMGYAGGLLKTEQEYINGRDWDKGFFYKPGITYTANFNVKKEKAAQMHCPQKVRHYLGAFLWQKTENIHRNSSYRL
jgi:hypothetical protein